MKINIWQALGFSGMLLGAPFFETREAHAEVGVNICMDCNNEKAPDPNSVFLLGGLICGVKAELNHAETYKTILVDRTTTILNSESI